MIQINRPWSGGGTLLMCYMGKTPYIAQSTDKITHQNIRHYDTLLINGSEKLKFPLKFQLLGIDYLMDFEGVGYF